MSFSERLTSFHNAVFWDDQKAAHELPLRSTAAKRALRMTPQDRALDWRLQVQDQAKEVRRTIETVTSRAILVTEVEALLRLIGEFDD